MDQEQLMDGSTHEPYRAVFWVSHCGRDRIKLTSREEGHLDEQTMLEIAMNRMADIEIDVLRGEFIFEDLDN